MSGEPHEEPIDTTQQPPASQTGEGGAGDGFISVTTEQRLIRRCLKDKDWAKQRWPTRATAEEIEEIKEERPLNFIELAVQAVGKDLTDQDRRVRRIAIKNLISMEKQNQADDHREDPDGGSKGPVQLVRVVVGDRSEVKNFESIKMKQLGEIIENEPQPTDEEIEDVD